MLLKAGNYLFFLLETLYDCLVFQFTEPYKNAINRAILFLFFFPGQGPNLLMRIAESVLLACQNF